MLRPGDRLGERYQLIEQIASGGMGTLWRAHHVELEVDVALKVVSPRTADPGAFKRFKREAQAAAKLRSPNIVQVLDYGEFDGQPYLAMELLRGEDLSLRLARLGRIPFGECVKIVDGVAKALQLAHDANIVHRDLKPANIFLEKVGEDEVVKVLDFGVAKDLNSAAEPGTATASGVVGSPAYMSPEQVWSHQVGHRADIWAMGVVAFEMLTGKNPFADETLAKVFERIVREPLPKPSQFDSDLPAELDAFFERALARSPKERIGSARDFADAFRAALDGREAPPPSRRPVRDTETQRAAAETSRTTITERKRHQIEATANGSRGRLLRWVGLALALAIGGALMVLSRADREPDVPGPPPAPPPRATASAPAAPPTVALVQPPTPVPEPSASGPLPSRRKIPKGSAAKASDQRDPKFGIPLGR